MKKILFSLILAGIASSVFFSLQASEETATAEVIHKLRKGFSQERIYPTEKYAAAVRREILPRVEKFVEQQGISLGQPIEAEAFKCEVDSGTYPACWMCATNGFKFTFNYWGKLQDYYPPDNWFDKSKEEKKDSKYLGENRMTSKEIESFARDFLKQQGYGESFAYYKTKPTLEGPLKTEKGTYPYVEVEWNSNPGNLLCSKTNDYYFSVQIDTDKKKLIGCRMYPSAVDIANNYAFFVQDPVQVKVKPMPYQDRLKQVYGKRAEVLDKLIHIDTVYSNVMTSFYIARAKECIDNVDFIVPETADFKEIASVYIDKKGYLLGSIALKNGWGFRFDRKGYIDGVCTPYDFFGGNTANEIEVFYGTNQMTTNEIVKLAEESLKKFGYDLQNYTNSTTTFSMEGPFVPKNISGDEHGFPYASVRWHCWDPYFSFKVDLNTEKKAVVSIETSVYDLSESDKRPAFEIGVIPETEAAYQARVQKEKEAVKN